MNKKAIAAAYDSRILAEQAMESRQHRPITEEDVLEILRELSKAFHKDGFMIGEITYVCELLFVVRGQQAISDILSLAEQRAKVVSMNGLWKIVLRMTS